MKFTYTVMFQGNAVGKKSCIAPDVEAFEFFIADKSMRHAQRRTGFSFQTVGFSIGA